MVCKYVIIASLKLQLFSLISFFLIAAAKKKTEVAGTGGGGIEGGTSSEIIPPSIRSDYIKGVCVCVWACLCGL